MTREELLLKQTAFFDSCLAISKAKNADYTGAGDDPFANFRVVEHMGLCSAEVGILVRMSDKMSRLASFAKNNVFQVKDESVADTLKDLSNYANLLNQLVESRKESFNPVRMSARPVDELDKIVKAYNR